MKGGNFMLKIMVTDSVLDYINMPSLLSNEGKSILEKLRKMGYKPDDLEGESTDKIRRYIRKVISMSDEEYYYEVRDNLVMVKSIDVWRCDSSCSSTTEEDSKEILKLLEDKKHYLTVVNGEYQVYEYVPNVNSNELTKKILSKITGVNERQQKLVNALSKGTTISFNLYEKIKDDLDLLMSKKFTEQELCLGYDRSWCCYFGLILNGSSFTVISVSESC